LSYIGISKKNGTVSNNSNEERETEGIKMETKN